MSTDTGSIGTAVSVESGDGIVVVHLDDGKANALTHDDLDALHAALDTAEADDAVGAVAIIGRPGRFSAGFDLSVMTAGPDQARDLLRAGGELALPPLRRSRSRSCWAAPATRWRWAPSC